MTTRAQKFRVGVFVMITALLLALVLLVFGGVKFWERQDTYHIVFSDSVMGLENGAPVHLNGIRVGRVSDIVLAPSDLKKVLVTIEIDRDSPIHTSTRAILQFAGITGLKVIDLRNGTLGAPLLPPGSTILQGPSVLDKLETQAMQLAAESEKLMKRANQIVENLVVLTDPKRFEHIDAIFAQSKTTIDSLAKTSQVLGKMFNENRTALRNSLASIEHAAKGAASMMDVEVPGIVAKAGELIAGLEGLVHTNEGQLRSAVFDLRQASRDFKELARDVRQRPSRLLFSPTPSERKLP